MTDTDLAQDVQEEPVVVKDAAPEVEENAAPEPAEAEERRPAGEERAWIDFDKPLDEQREQIAARLNILTGQARRAYEISDQTLADNRRYHDELTALRDRLSNWESGQNAQRVQSEIAKLEGDLQTAMDEGDAKKVLAVTRRITALEMGTTAPKREEPKPESAKPSAMPKEEIEAINRWAGRRDYAQPDSPDHQWTVDEIGKLYKDPEWDWKPVDEKLKEVDRRFKEKSAPKRPDVLTTASDAPSRGQKKGVQLTEPQKAVARRMFPEKTQADAYKAYAEGLD